MGGPSSDARSSKSSAAGRDSGRPTGRTHRNVGRHSTGAGRNDASPTGSATPGPSLAHIKTSESLQRIQIGAAELLRYSQNLSEQRAESPGVGMAYIEDQPSDMALHAMTKLSDDIASGVGEMTARRKHTAAEAATKHAGQSHEHDDQNNDHRHHKSSRRRQKSNVGFSCHACHRVETPQWRPGPDGPGTLCNVCGLVYARRERRKQAPDYASRSLS